MIDPEGAIDILHRIDTVRRARCGDRWVQPPDDWADIVKASWPQVWRTSPVLPAGWCDLAMAFSEHLTEIADGREMAFGLSEDLKIGWLLIWRQHAFWGAYEENILTGYCSVARSTCRVCGSEGEARRFEKTGIVQVLCDEHWQGA